MMKTTLFQTSLFSILPLGILCFNFLNVGPATNAGKNNISPQDSYQFHQCSQTCTSVHDEGKAIPFGRMLAKDVLKAKPNYRLRTITIDAGHGGRDKGSNGKGYKEKNITLSAALELGTLIKTYYPEIKVVYTRQSDKFISLNKRAAIANNSNSDLFISLHCNALPKNTRVNGSETYVLGLHKSKENLEVVKRENESIFLEEDYQTKYSWLNPNSTEGHILSEIDQSNSLEQSILLASKIEKQLQSGTSIKKSRGVKQAGFVVLKATSMPSVLVEMGYLSNFRDRKYLNSKEGQKQVAASILNALSEYKQEIETGETTRVIVVKDKKVKNKIPPTTSRKKQITDVHPVMDKAVVELKIQLAASQTELKRTERKWQAVKDVSQILENGVFKYVTNSYFDLPKAKKRLAVLKRIGFKDAFIVAYKNGYKVPVKEAYFHIKP